MKIIPKNIRWRSIVTDARFAVLCTALVFAIALFSFCGTVWFAAEEDSDASECLTGQITSFSPDAQPQEIVVSGNNSYLVHLKVDGEAYTYCYDKDDDQTVLDLLYRNDVYLNADDTINHNLSAELEADMSVEVGRVSYEEVTKQESIPYKTKQVLTCFALSKSLNGYYNNRLKNTQGVPGVREITTRVKKVDGKVVESTVVSSKVISKPKDALVYVDADYLLNVGSGAPTSYVEKLDCRFTAYTYDEVGPSYTASGAKAQVGYVAVDRKLIPLHSYLYIVLDNGFVYGYCYAKDTGGAIKGNIVDLFLPSEIDCYWFGRRTGTVYVISRGS
ncbi:MAG: G5 domain-containing protein [Clostridia bacterium]|nr:G5 domain-containing protein [Clostridia bacterium]